MGLIRFIFSKTFLKQLGIAAVVLLVGFFVLRTYLNGYTDHGEYVTVPDVSGVLLADAQRSLLDVQLTGALVDSIWRQGAIPGAICEQSPAAGVQVKSGRPVYLTAYRQRPSFVKVGVEAGERKNVAAIRLQNKGVDFKIKYEPHELLYDCVIRVEHKGKEVGPKHEIRRDERLTLVVGERRNDKVGVPNVYGMSLDSAAMVFNLHSLALGFSAYDGEVLSAQDSSSCWIYEQRPLAGVQPSVRAGSEINVWLTNRPRVQSPPESKSEEDDDLFD